MNIDDICGRTVREEELKNIDIDIGIGAIENKLYILLAEKGEREKGLSVEINNEMGKEIKKFIYNAKNQ